MHKGNLTPRRGISEKVALWRGRLMTLQAVMLLSSARFLIEFVPFRSWKQSLGLAGDAHPPATKALRIARLVDHAATRGPGTVKCLPRAVVLSWLLRRQKIPHVLVLAARPAGWREEQDVLHAWVEVAGEKVIGDALGPWIETLRLD